MRFHRFGPAIPALALILTAFVASDNLVAKPKDKGDKGSNGFSNEKTELVPPDPAPDADARGRLEVWQKAKDGRERMRVQARRLNEHGSYSVWIEIAVGAGLYAHAADLQNDGGGSFSWKIDTKEGDHLPLGVSSVDDLAGRGLQVQNAAENVILQGFIPSLE